MRFPIGVEFIRLHPHSKEPVQKNWSNTKEGKTKIPSLTPEQVRDILRQGGNYGIRIRACDLIIDIDPRNGGNPAKLPFDYSGFPTVVTPSGGLHIYCTLPPNTNPKAIAHTIPEYGKGVEFKIKGQYVVGPGSIHPDFPNGPKYAWDETFGPVDFSHNAAPDILIQKILKSGYKSGSDTDITLTDVIAMDSLLVTNEQLEFILERLDVTLFAEHDKWFNFMCACHEATGGNGRPAFVSWCTSDPRYAGHGENIAMRWDSLKAGQAGSAGKGTFLHILLEHGINDIELDRGAEEDFKAFANREYNPPSGPGHKPVIRVRGGSLEQNFKAIEQALGEQTKNRPEFGIYQRGGLLVRIARYAGTIDVPDEEGIHRDNGTMQILSSEGTLQLHTTSAAMWQKFDARSEEWKPINAPLEVVQALGSAAGMWPTIPELHGISESPTMRLNGTILDKPGYDEMSGLFFDAKIPFDAVKDKPTREDALRALDELLEINKGFPFVEPVDRSVSLSMQLTPFARHAMRSAPMFIIAAPKMGSGKTLMSNLPNYLVAGKASSLFSQADNPEEDKKRLLALLLEGSLVTVIDNIEKPLKSDALCTALTEPSIKDRILGSTKVISVPTKTVWIATGNNVRVDGDLTSRCVLCRIDPKTERPEERHFDVNLHEYVPKNRGRLVAACLTILRAYVVATRAEFGGNPADRVRCVEFGRFEQWSQLIREPLIWLGLDDPCASRRIIESRDPVRDTLGNLLETWYKHFGPAPRTIAKTLLELQGDLEHNYDDLEACLMSIAGERGRINAFRVGNFIAKHENRIERGFHFERFSGGNGTGIAWRAVPVSALPDDLNLTDEDIFG